jgi:hypothetical protein
VTEVGRRYAHDFLVAGGPAPATGAPANEATKPTEIKGEFPREVPPEGGILDFDVKAEVSKS